MANWNKPDLSSREVDAINEYKNRDVDSAQMFDVGTPSNIPENAIRFNVASGVLQRRETNAWVSKLLSVAGGGTGASSAAGARSNLGLGGVATENTVPVSKGGTGATSAASARSNLGTNNAGNITTGTLASGVLPDASTTVKGAVVLNNSTTSNSTTQAATANAVKLVADRSVVAGDGLSGGGNLQANRTLSLGTPSSVTVGTSNSVTSGSHTHNLDLSGRTISTTAPLSGGGNLGSNRTLSIADASLSVKGAVQLSGSINSTSNSLAATAGAVKQAYDFAASASGDAFDAFMLADSADNKSTPLTSSESTTNSSSGSGHTHEITGFLESSIYADGIGIPLGGMFSTGSFSYVKVGGAVIAHVSSNSHASQETTISNVIPAFLHPSNSVIVGTQHTIGSTIVQWTLTTSGTLVKSTYNDGGTLLSTTNAGGPITLSWVVET